MGLDIVDSSLVQTNNQDNGVIDIVIGSDYYYEIVMGDIVRYVGKWASTVAVNSKFGCVLSGRSASASQSNNATLSHLVIQREDPASYILPGSVNQDDSLSDSPQRFWNTESIGIKIDIVNDGESQSKEFLPEVHFDEEEGRYEVNHLGNRTFSKSYRIWYVCQQIASVTFTSEERRHSSVRIQL